MSRIRRSALARSESPISRRFATISKPSVRTSSAMVRASVQKLPAPSVWASSPSAARLEQCVLAQRFRRRVRLGGDALGVLLSAPDDGERLAGRLAHASARPRSEPSARISAASSSAARMRFSAARSPSAIRARTRSSVCSSIRSAACSAAATIDATRSATSDAAPRECPSGASVLCCATGQMVDGYAQICCKLRPRGRTGVLSGTGTGCSREPEQAALGNRNRVLTSTGTGWSGNRARRSPEPDRVVRLASYGALSRGVTSSPA